MKYKIILAIFLYLIYQDVFSQNSHLIKIPSYNFSTTEAAGLKVIVQMSYGKGEITGITGDTDKLHRASDIIIDVVFTDHPSHQTLEQLNNGRLQRVYNALPHLQKHHVNQVNYYRQMNGAEKGEAINMFHGVVIKFQEVQDKKTMEHDLAMLEKLLSPVTGSLPVRDTAISKDTVHGKKSYSLLKHVTSVAIDSVDSMVVKEVRQKASMKLFKKKHYDSMATMEPIEAFRKDFLPTTELSNWAGRSSATVYFKKQKVRTRKETYRFDTVYNNKLGTFTQPLPDSTVFKAFERNRWRNYATVGDVTGSMYTYTAQLLIWLKLQSLDSLTTAYTFFNDGDNTPDNKKKMGKTGGIYTKTCKSYVEVAELVKSTMAKGGGGDMPENNIEALLNTEATYPDIRYTVLIADNWAKIKDLKLADKLSKPVRIVLCGVDNYNINLDYLNLARMTNGSIHLIEDDITNLASMHEGEVLNFGARSFQIKQGKFVEL